MTEHLINTPPEHIPQASDQGAEVRLAPERMTPDWRRFDVAASRFRSFLTGGIGSALEEQRDIDPGTARCIAHVLGRSLGRQSALADYGRTGNGFYAELREEYLSLLADPDASSVAHELINWFGTHLIRENFPKSETISSPEPYPLTLDRLLVPTEVDIGEQRALVHVPGIYGSESIAELTDTLTDLHIHEDTGLQAFLKLPNVDAMSGDIMGDFDSNFAGTWQTIEEALTELCEVNYREEEIRDYAAERRMFFDYLTPDYEALQEEAEEAFDLVEHGGVIHVFAK